MNTKRIEIRERPDAMIRSDLADTNPSDADLATLFALRDRAKKHDLTVAKLAQKLRCSTGTIYLVYNGKYPAGIETFCDRVRAWLSDQEKEDTYSGRRNFVRTGLASDLMSTFERVRFTRRIQTIESAEQMGKSTAAREYVAAHKGRAVLITLKPGDSQSVFGMFLRDLASALEYDPNNQKTVDIRSAIDARLEEIEVVLIDEAHMMHSWSKPAVRQMLDFIRINIQADGRRGVCLIFTTPDNATVDTSCMSLLQSMRVHARYNLGQLFGRMSSSVLTIDSSDIDLADVRSLVERYYKPGRDCLAKLHKAAIREGLGHLGLVDSVVSDAAAEAHVTHVELADALVLQVLDQKLADIERRERTA